MNFTSTVNGASQERRSHKRRRSLLVLPVPPVGPPRRCGCGGCKLCVENARWERIFDERFADPDYYGPKLPRVGSTLSQL